MARGPRPFGISILGVLVVLTGVALVLIGLAGMFVSLAALIPGTGLGFRSLFVGGLVFFGIGLVLLAAGGGLLALRVWAWWLAVIAAAVALAFSGYDAVSSGTVDLVTLLASALEVIILSYLVSVYRRFRPRQIAVT